MQLTATLALTASLALISAAEDGKPSTGLRRVEKALGASMMVADAQPRIESAPKDREHTLLLPTAMQDALQRHDVDFKTRREGDYLASIVARYSFSAEQAPFAVVGDFNGDGILDAVMMGHNETHDLTLAVLSRARGGYRIVEESRGPRTDPKKEWYGMGGGRKEFGLSTYLTLVKRRKLASKHEDAPLDLSSDAFQSNSFEKSAVVRYYSDCEFQSYIVGD